MAGADGLRRVRLGHGERRADAALSRAAAGGDDAADRAHGAGQRLRRVDRDAGRPRRPVVTALCARRRSLRTARRASRPSRAEPWPTWTFARRRRDAGPPGDLRPARRIAAVVVRWRLLDDAASARRVDPRSIVRPFLSGRDYHAHAPRERRAARRAAASTARWCVWQPLRRPARRSCSRANARLRASARLVSRNSCTRAERERGLDDVEDLCSPGELTFDARRRRRGVAARARGPATRSRRRRGRRRRRSTAARLDAERAGARPSPPASPAPPTPTWCARGGGRTIVAGYPWFTDWGRDTFIALRGLCLATGRARRGARHPARVVRRRVRGHAAEPLPRRRRRARSSTRVDASLWFIVAVGDAARRRRRGAGATRRAPIAAACSRRSTAIVEGYARGTRYGIRMDADGLLACGEPGVQLTWMDAQGRRLGGDAAHRQAGRSAGAVAERAARARRAGARPTRRAGDSVARPGGARPRPLRRGVLERRRPAASTTSSTSITSPGASTRRIRPNQIFAVGGLRRAAARRRRARARSSTSSSARLWTPLGLRSLAPGEPGYVAHYDGGRRGARRRLPPGHGLAVADRRVRRGLAARARRRRRRARARRGRGSSRRSRRTSTTAGIGHVSEIADAEPPLHAARLPVPGVVGRRADLRGTRRGRAGWRRRWRRPQGPAPEPRYTRARMSVFDEEPPPTSRRGPMLLVMVLGAAVCAGGAWFVFSRRQPPAPAETAARPAPARPRPAPGREPARSRESAGRVRSTGPGARAGRAHARRPPPRPAPPASCASAATCPARRSSSIASSSAPRRWTSTGWRAGSHRLNVSVDGYEGHAQAIEIGETPADVDVRFKDVRLNASRAGRPQARRGLVQRAARRRSVRAALRDGQS